MSENGEERHTDKVREAMPFAALLGIDGVTVEGGAVTARLVWREELCTASGIIHGGALMALADSLGAYCAMLHLPEGAATTTIESKTNFLRAVRGGAVSARSRPLHAGRTVIVVDTELTDETGRLVARVTQTQAVLAGRG